MTPEQLETVLVAWGHAFGERNLDPSLIERYMAEFKDTTPALFWAAKHLQDALSRQQQARAQLPGLVDQLNRILAEAGVGQ